MADRQLAGFVSRFKERYRRSLRMRRLVFELNRLVKIQKGRKLMDKELESKWYLWQKLEDELS
ncbi:MAG: hypothetical protein Sv326_0419 [Candidatus Fermentimicrarchaeum limneticum]|uniref:Uncharacterized protein n=1 Tax=Fermentimicrarchaeum limneticum TaxID=2795018 RepID=A0A7D6B9T7_FERL1|nr:MAG: hypothetical protein Sv326_0345 [Candidatus Fermentimicrarchaeum limneticum]QLJ52557.1 MAG: hypothetical protein Sv326_0382 [Candidatus Fermentimicrarchaeum limneticum]QLJ52594.1 MAG: hypothetical protein Sv326_0419 [Candidatus Fermentimicrarchaeum limneticum]